MKKRWILRFEAFAFAMTTIFTITLQKNNNFDNLYQSEVSALTEEEGLGNTICKCKIFGGSICSCAGWGAQCASFKMNGNCATYDDNCR